MSITNWESASGHMRGKQPDIRGQVCLGCIKKIWDERKWDNKGTTLVEEPCMICGKPANIMVGPKEN